MKIYNELRVKEILKEKNIKMYELANMMGITPESLTRSLQKNPRYSTLKSISNVLNIPVRDLFKGDENENTINGIITINSSVYYIKSIDDIFNLIKKLNPPIFIEK